MSTPFGGPGAGDAGAERAGPRRAIGASTLFLLLAFAVAAISGARATARGDGVLAALDPVVALARDGGARLTTWGLQHGAAIRNLVTAAVALVVAAALASGRRRALPLLPMAAAVVLAASGQTFLLEGRESAGVRLYLAALGAAAIFGFACTPGRERGQPARAPRWWVDGVAVAAATTIGLVLRLHALDRLPSMFEGEMSTAMLASRTLAGIAAFVPLTAQDTSIGFAHMPVQWLSFRLFGSSVYSLRLAAVAIGSAMIPAMYWLLRGLCGRCGAVVAALLLATAPEQLWWSRSENVNFIAACFAGMVSASLAWRLRRRLSVAAATAAALWLPFTRYFYLAAILLVGLPWLVLAHALLFAGAARRRLVRLVPVVAAGTILWVASLPIANSLIAGQPWHFVNPATHGELVMRRDAEGRGAGWIQLAAKQAESVRQNVVSVATAFTYRGGFSQWFDRIDAQQNPTWANVGVSAAAALGVAVLLGRIHTPQAGVLLGWLLVGMLPALLGTLPESRRMCVAFPALYAAAGYGSDAVLRAVRERGGVVAAAFGAGCGALGLAAVLLSGAASHLQMPAGVPPLVTAQRWAAEIVRDSDAIYYDGDPGILSLLVLGNADRFLQRPPCVRFVRPNEWLNVALRQPCEFNDDAFRAILTAGERRALSAAYKAPRRVTFLLSRFPRSVPALALLRSLFPEAPVNELDTGEIGTSFSAMTIDRAALDARGRPELRAEGGSTLPDGIESRLLRDAKLRTVDLRDDASPSGLVVDGGLLLGREDWYRVRVAPACEAAELSVDGKAVAPDATPRPMLAGAHPFRLRLPAADACVAPLAIELESRGGGKSVVEPAPLVSPVVAATAGARAAAVRMQAGYVYDGLLRTSERPPIDARAAADGSLLVLVEDGGRRLLRRYDAKERREAEWEVRIPPELLVTGMMVGPQAQVLLVSEEGIWVFDAGGEPAAHWAPPPFHSAEQTFLPDGRVAACVPEHAAVEVFAADGRREQVFDGFDGGPGKFVEPIAISMSAGGDIVVAQTNGLMLLFRTPPDRFAPTYVGGFSMDFSLPSVLPRSLTFSGPERILAGDPERLRFLEYGRDGTRWMAAERDKDWAAITARTGEIRRLIVGADRYYVLAGEPGLRRLRR